MNGSGKRSRPMLAAGVIALALGAAIRLLAIRGDLWLEEIRPDEGRPPGSWLAPFEGDERPELLRLPALAASLAALPLIAAAAGAPGSAAWLWGAVLGAFSYPLVLYGTEARGYSFLIFASAAALLGFRRVFTACSARGAPSYAAAALAAGLAVLSAVSYAALARGGAALREALLVSFDTASVTFGGPEFSPSRPDLGWIVLAHGVLCLALVLHGLKRAFLRGDRDALMLLLVLVIVPPAAYAAWQPRVLSVGHFLPQILFALVVIARTFGALWERDRAGRLAAVLLTAAFLGGSWSSLEALFRYGRGTYSSALELMVRAAPQGAAVTVTSDHDLRNRTVLEETARRANLAGRIAYVESALASEARPEWYIAHSRDRALSPPARVSVSRAEYELVREFGSAPLSGWRWFLYRAADGDPRRGAP